MINCNGNLLSLAKPKIMGILNITPDSFFDGGKNTEVDQILNRAKKILSEGADIIDVGACSSRPNANDVSETEEIDRLSKALTLIRKHFPDACISVDTFRANVAKFVVENFKVDIINDIFAGFGDEKMLETIRNLQIPYIMMHMQGTPKTMQQNPQYDDVVLDIIKFFSERINKATLLGINDIIIDPGFGFGKTIEHNYELMRRLEEFEIVDYPLLVGVSRKSMIYKSLEITAEESLPGTIVLNTIALQKGAKILRVHDVAEAVQTLKIVSLVK
ncbi:MAG: dihydropteroate synthase [Bacteroidales bacterium]|nr:dihydropteroate synthase [Bacteroidales bacterium]